MTRKKTDEAQAEMYLGVLAGDLRSEIAYAHKRWLERMYESYGSKENFNKEMRRKFGEGWIDA